MSKIKTPENINQLRSILLENISKLSNSEIEIETAKQMTDAAQVVIRASKLELDYAVYHNKGVGNKDFFEGK